MTTKGCDLHVQFKDGSTEWVPLKDLKVSNPVDVAEYTVAHKLDQKPQTIILPHRLGHTSSQQ